MPDDGEGGGEGRVPAAAESPVVVGSTERPSSTIARPSSVSAAASAAASALPSPRGAARHLSEGAAQPHGSSQRLKRVVSHKTGEYRYGYGTTLTQHGSYVLMPGTTARTESTKRPSSPRFGALKRSAFLQALWTAPASGMTPDELSAFEYTFKRELDDAEITREEFDARMVDAASEEAFEIKRDTSSLAIEERLTLGAYFLDDAVARRRTCKVRWSVPLYVTLYRIHRHRAWYLLMSTCSLALCALAAAEPAQTWVTPARASTLGVEAVLVAITMADVLMPTLYVGPRSFFGQGADSKVKAATVALLALDVCVSAGAHVYGVPTFRFSRPVRPMLIFYSQKAARHSVYAIASTLPALSDVFLLLIIVITMFAIASLSLFGAETAAWPTADGEFGDTYSTFWASWLTLFTLITSENFPSAMLITLDGGSGSALAGSLSGRASIVIDWVLHSVYFGVFFVLTAYMILSVFVAVIFENYKLHHKRVVIEGKRRERRALLAAFSMVDTDGDALLSLGEFYRLMKRFRGRSSTREARAIHKILDTDATGDISLHEFLNVCDLLVLRPRERVGVSSASAHACCAPVPAAHWLVRRATFHLLIYLTIVLNAIFVLVRLIQGDGAGIPPPAYQVIDRVFLAVFFSEMVLKILGLTWRGYISDPWNRFDMALVVAGVLSEVIEEVVFASSAGGGGEAAAGALSDYLLLRVVRVLRLIRVMRTVRVVTTSSRLRALVRTFLNMLPMFASIFWVIAMFMYAFALVGLEVLHSDTPLGSADDYGAYPPSFADLVSVLWTLTLVLVGNGWADIMLTTMSTVHQARVAAGDAMGASLGASFAALYYVLYFLVLNLVLINLLMALVIEVYAVEVEKSAERADERGAELLDALREQGVGEEGAGEGEGEGGGAAGGAATLSGRRGSRDIGVRVAHQIFSVMTQSVRTLFAKYDRDGDGLIQPAQCFQLLAELGAGLSEEELRGVVARLDIDQSGFIEFREFLDWWQEHGLRRAFAEIDTDGSGAIDASELAGMLYRLGIVLAEADVELALQQMDKEEDGRITLPELMRWWNRFDIMSIFAMYDADGSGRLSFDELADVVHDLGLKADRRDVKRALELLDRDRDEGISIDEFFPLWELLSNRTRDRGSGASAALGRGASGKWEDNLFLRRSLGGVDGKAIEVRGAARGACRRAGAACAGEPHGVWLGGVGEGARARARAGRPPPRCPVRPALRAPRAPPAGQAAGGAAARGGGAGRGGRRDRRPRERHHARRAAEPRLRTHRAPGLTRDGGRVQTADGQGALGRRPGRRRALDHRAGLLRALADEARAQDRGGQVVRAQADGGGRLDDAAPGQDRALAAFGQGQAGEGVQRQLGEDIAATEHPGPARLRAAPRALGKLARLVWLARERRPRWRRRRQLGSAAQARSPHARALARRLAGHDGQPAAQLAFSRAPRRRHRLGISCSPSGARLCSGPRPELSDADAGRPCGRGPHRARPHGRPGCCHYCQRASLLRSTESIYRRILQH